MKGLMCFLLTLGFVSGISAQSQEWEQLRLDLEKLAQLKLLLSEAKSGYEALATSYDRIIQTGKSNYQMHDQYLEGLNAVSPAIRNSPVAGRVDSVSQQIRVDGKALVTAVQRSGLFSSGELAALSVRVEEINAAVGSDKSLLQLVMTYGKVRMSDGERSQVINHVDQYIQNQASRLKGLQDQYYQLIALRLQNQRDLNSLQRLTHFK